MSEDISNRVKSPAVQMRRAGLLAFLVALAVIVADQWLKIYVKTHFYLGEDLPITSWFHLKFIENNGMAFGFELGSKIFLTLARIVAVVALIWFLSRIRRMPGIRYGFIVAVSLIMAGAAGNIFDCIFYGEIFNNPYPPEVAQIFPKGGGYASWFEGRVVDMLYFPLFSFYWPAWMPFVGGEFFEFFAYIFNIADASICIGVGMLLIFYSSDVSQSFHYLSEMRKGKERKKEA